MKVPSRTSPTPIEMPKVDEADVLMAAAQMHEMGRLVERPKDYIEYDAIRERWGDPEYGDVVQQQDAIMELRDATDKEKRNWDSKGYKNWEDQNRYQREHPQRNQYKKPMFRDRT